MTRFFKKFLSFFFFNDTATTEIYTLSLHDALPISRRVPLRLERARHREPGGAAREAGACCRGGRRGGDRKSTRLNSSHRQNSYAVFCLKKKKENALTKQYTALLETEDVHLTFTDSA